MRLTTIVGVVALAGAAACGSESYGPGSTTGGHTKNLTMQNIAFHPSPDTVAAGDTVTWANQDAVSHTVTSSSVPGGATSFDSGNLVGGSSYRRVFTVAGTYAYYCQVHGQATMHATLVVLP